MMNLQEHARQVRTSPRTISVGRGHFVGVPRQLEPAKAMKFLIRALQAVTFVAMTAAAATADEPIVGATFFMVPSEEREIDLAVTVWYPAASGGEAAVLGENIFFEGTPAMIDAPIMDGAFPLILLSHGAGLAGRAEAMSWIAAPLARQGFIVAAPTHPGNTGPDRSAEETMRLWLRPADISATLDAIEADTTFRRHIAPGGPGVLGLSMGGGTALSLAGARLDPERFASYCDTSDRNASLCAWVRMSGVDLRQMDMDAVGQDNGDPRFRFVMAIDPAPVDIFAMSTFSEITIPVALVNLGNAADIPETLQASEIAEAIPDATYHLIEDATHASMFPRCRPGAAAIALEEGIEDPICSDGGRRARDEIHNELVDLVASFFHRALAPD